jgi:hypothetical protein
VSGVGLGLSSLEREELSDLKSRSEAGSTRVFDVFDVFAVFDVFDVFDA